MSDSATLFSQLPPEAATPSTTEGPFAGVAIEQSIDRVLDYAIPAKLRQTIQVGQRVRVPLGRGNRPAHGYVVSIHPTANFPRVKNILDIEDDRVLVPPAVMALAQWISRYYMAPLGVTLDSVIPSAVRKRVGLPYANIVRLAMEPAKVQEIIEQTKAPKRRAILARLLLVEKDRGIDLIRLASESDTKPATIRKLARLRLITICSEADLPRLTDQMPDGPADEKEIELNPEQKIAYEALDARIASGGFSVNLLHGVTGSGKTEVYLQCIARAVERGKRALVMVPEIALSPQTARRFRARFKRVAILHSGLGATERHKFWQQIRQGRADVVVGARSAVFAPMDQLGVIVVDEEHDSSYKQDQVPRYHGRDAAIKRAQLENIPVILGSATPSLEMYQRCHREPAGPRYHYLPLPNRVRGLAMPAVELIDMGTERRQRRGVHLISQRLELLLKNTLNAGHQAMILLNRRGYANFVFCNSCGHICKCKYCDATMTYHRSADAHAKGASFAEGLHTGQLHCHYCLAVNALPAQCPVCSKKLTLFGLGTQRVEEELARKMPQAKFARIDSDSMRSARDYEAILAKFANKEIQVLLGTQMIAKGLDYPNVTLVGVISADTALALPDFRSSERTFQLITQVAGRAGRGDAAGRVLVQTFLPDDPTIRHAIKHDYAAFANSELPSRREVGLPPLARMARIIIRDQEQPALHELSQKLAEELTKAVAKAPSPVRMRGPMPCPITRIAGYYRNQIVLSSASAEAIQQTLAAVRELGAFGKAESVAVDVDPVSLL